MPGNELRFIRNMKSGIPLYLRMQKEGGSWRRLEVIDETYFRDDVGERVDDESGKQRDQIEKKYGRKVGRAIIEEGYHTSDNDAISHAGVSYEDKNGDHLSSRHVAEKAEEQRQSDSSNENKKRQQGSS
ncbi:hypothetical protein FQN54_001333 [Arachnomyces sp. PD_36]|nr:hypothetical protein FQN54_001333 [Arachnomyces sp. PD_36]